MNAPAPPAAFTPASVAAPDDAWTVAGRTFRSRLIVGTGGTGTTRRTPPPLERPHLARSPSDGKAGRVDAPLA